MRHTSDMDEPGLSPATLRMPRLRQVGPTSLVVDAEPSRSGRVAFHLYRGTVKVQERGYGAPPTARFDALAPGSYCCRVYVVDPISGSRSAVSTDRVQIEALRPGPALVGAAREQYAVVGLHSTAALLAMVLAHHHDVLGLVAPGPSPSAELCGLRVIGPNEVPASATVLDPSAAESGPGRRPAWRSVLDEELSRLTAMQMYRVARRLYLAGAEREASHIKARIYREYNCILPFTAEIGEGTRLGYGGIGTVIHAKALIGRDCVIGQNVTVGARAEAPRIGDGVFIGPGSVTLSPEIGAGAVVGANSTVLLRVPPGAVIAGSPARVIRMAGSAPGSTGPVA